MAWVKLTDDFARNPKIARVGSLGIGLWVAGLAYCNQNQTDGFIPRNIAHGLVMLDYVDKEGTVWELSEASGVAGRDLTGLDVAERLVEAGLWYYADGGYEVHDYADYQPTRYELETTKKTLSEKRREAGRKGGMRSSSRRSKTKQTPILLEAKPGLPADLLEAPESLSGSGLEDGSDVQANAEASKQTPTPGSRTRIELSSTEEPDGSSSSQALGAARKPRPRDLIWDALVEECGYSPGTPTERGAWNKARKEIGDQPPGEVAAKAAMFKRRYPDLRCTPTALVRQWGALGEANGQPRRRTMAEVEEVIRQHEAREAR